MALIALWEFNETGATAGSTAADDAVQNGAQNGVYTGGATATGGDAVFDGSGDYIEVAADPAFQLAQGTLIMEFSPDITATRSVFSRDSTNFDGGGHFDLRVESDGSVVARHQTTSNSLEYSTPAGFYSAGDDIRVSYSWNSDGTGGTFYVENLTQATTFSTATAGNLTWDQGAFNEPIVIGASQRNSGDNVADNINFEFDGTIAMVAIYDEVIPQPGDFVVEGTSGNDVIDASYLGDPEGDRIDNSDAQNGSNDDAVLAGDGDDTIAGGDGADIMYGEGGDDTFLIDSFFGNDTIVGGETSETQGDLIDASLMFDDLLVTFTVEGEGTFTDGFDAIDFSEIERIHLGDGFDSVVGSSGVENIDLGDGSDSFQGNEGDDIVDLGDFGGVSDGFDDFIVLTTGFGNDTYTNFDVPIDNGDGTYSGVDLFDVASMVNGGGGPVSTANVTVTDDGSGNALLSFDGGETVTLIGVSPTYMNNPDVLEAAGIPKPSTDYVIVGTSGNDVIDAAYVGDPTGDRIDNGDAANGSDDDEVNAGQGNDTVVAGLGADRVFGQDGNDTLFGGEGNDLLDGDDTIAGDDMLYGEAGADELIGDGGNDFLSGGSGIDQLFGGTGDDELRGGTEADIMFGQEGDDTFVLEANFGDDDIAGGEVAETLGDTVSTTPISVSITVTYTDAEEGTVFDGTSTAAFREIERFELGAGDDEFLGTVGSQSVDLGAGADIAVGGSGDDTIDLGSNGAGSADGDADTVQLTPGGGADTLLNFEAPIDNGDGTFTGVDQLDVSLLINGGGQPVDVDDVVVTDDGSGNAVMTFPNGVTATLMGVAPSAVSSGPQLIALGIPSAQNFIVEGTVGADTITSPAYVGDPEGDLIDSNDAADNSNDDVVQGGAGNDTINAGLGNDTIFGGADSDTITVVEGQGSDIVTGGESGTDTDRLILSETTAQGVTVTYTTGEAGTFSFDSGQSIGSFSEIEEIQTTGNDDTIDASLSTSSVLIDAGAGDDTITAGDFGSTIFAGSNTDVISGGAGNDSIFGQGGVDWITISEGGGTDTIDGGSGGGDDDLTFVATGAQGVTVTYTSDEAGTFAFDSGSGNGFFSDIEEIFTTGFADTVNATAATGISQIFTGAGDDVVTLSGSDNQVELGQGADTITLGSGNDTVDLGSNVAQTAADGDVDTIVLTDGFGAEAQITNFEAPTPNGGGGFTGQDLLDVTGLTNGAAQPVNTNDVTVSDDGSGNAVLSFPNGEGLTLIGVAPAAVSAPEALVAMGIPIGPDYIVEGTAGDDNMFGPGYAGDPEGDRLDSNDALDGSNDDFVQAGAGKDLVLGGLGDDEIYGEAGTDWLEGGIGSDELYGGEGDDYIVDFDVTDMAALYTGDQRPLDPTVETDDGAIDTLQGDAGNDVLIAGLGADILDGGADDDTLLGGQGADTITGGSGDDTIILEDGFGSDNIDAGETLETAGDTLDATRVTSDTTVTLTTPENGTIASGADTATFQNVETINLGSGADTVTGSALADTIDTGRGADIIDAGAGDDTISLGLNLAATGNDGDADTLILDDGDGSDTIFHFEAPIDNGDGTFTGVDQIDVSALTNASGAPVSTNDVTVTDDGSGNALLTFANGEALTLVGVLTSEVSSIAQLVALGIPIGPDFVVDGTSGNDVIDAAYLGDPEGDVIDGNDAADGSNDDVVQAGAGADVVQAGAGNDTVYGGDGNDLLEGGAGNDTLVAGNNVDTLIGGLGADILDGSVGGIDTASYTDSSVGVTIDLTDALAEVGGTAQGDQLIDIEVIIGSAFDDSIFADNSGQRLEGGDGEDLLVSGSGVDTILGGSGDDTIAVRDNFRDDVLTAGETGETLGDTLDASALTQDATLDLSLGSLTQGTSGASISEFEFYVLGSGNDTVFGSILDDNVVLGDGNDTVSSGTGSDVLDGGAGFDTANYSGSAVAVQVDLSDAFVESGGDADGDTLTNFEQIDGSLFGDTLIADGSGLQLRGLAGADILRGGAGSDTLEGGDDADTIFANVGDTVDGGDGGTDNDTLDLTGTVAPGGSMNVTITGADSDGNGSDGFVEYFDNGGSSLGVLNFSNIENIVPCFTPETRIKTMRGEVAAADIVVDDMVLTHDHGYQPVRWVGSKRVALHSEAAQALQPIRIKAGALGAGRPERDLVVSPQHRVLLRDLHAELLFGEEDVLIPALHLLALEGVEQLKWEEVVYIHFMFDQHELVMGDGAWSESFQPGEQTLGCLEDGVRAELLAIFPELAEAPGLRAYGAARMSLKKHQTEVLLRAAQF